MASGHTGDLAPARPRSAEVTEVHTRILRCTLATEDAYSYWQKVDSAALPGDRARVAFARRWFGTKSEARVRTLIADMAERFDAYPEALELLHALGTVPAKVRPLICHLHVQLADPIYRRFTGEWLPERRDQGHSTVDRTTVTRWVETIEPGRWSTVTAVKFASNLLATALEAGLIAERRDPRRIMVPEVPDLVLGYALYLLRGISIEGSLLENPYLRSFRVTSATFRAYAPRVPGIRYVELGGASELVFLEPSLRVWGMKAFREEAS